MRLLVDEYRLEWDVALGCYNKDNERTNYTILAEALEKMGCRTFQKVLPRVYFQIILEIDNRFVSDMASDGVVFRLLKIHVL